MTTITISAHQFSDSDDCLAAAAQHYIAEHPDLVGWDLDPKWADDDREEIILTVPA